MSQRATPQDVARGMIARYRSARVAADMAGFHACDYPEASEPHAYWCEVSQWIAKLSNTKGCQR